MIDIEIVKNIHDILIDQFGGIRGVRDNSLLDAALARPYATFDQQDLYPEPVDKAAAVLENLVINHPFMDGNKRISYVIMRLTLNKFGFDIIADQDEKYNIIIAASQGQLRFEEIRTWLKSKLIEI